MPHYIDIHEVQGANAAAVADAHAKDVEVQTKYGVNYVKYWLNESRGKIFCLCSAPSAEAADRVHREAHGLAAERIIEVDPELADDFLGGGMVGSTGIVTFGQNGRHDTAIRTILFTDIVGSTAMTQRLGDKAAMAILDVHDAVVRRCLGANGGREVKHLGDGIMAVFVSAEDAVRCATAIQRELAAHASNGASQPIEIRIGAATGEPVERHGDFFGSTVQLAARLCAQAEPGQMLVSAEVTEACNGRFQFTDRGAVALKGFDKPVRAFSIRA